MVRDADVDFLRDLDMNQKRSLICREMNKMRGELQGYARVAISMFAFPFLDDG